MEQVIQDDPTLRLFMRELIPTNDHQLKIRIAASKIAFSKYLDKKYPTK